MKKIVFIATLICCMFVTSANAGESTTKSQYDACQLVTQKHWGWGGDWVKYGLIKDGNVILNTSFNMDYMEYNPDLHIFVFRGCESDIMQSYRMVIYSSETGQCLYTGRYYAQNNGNYKPWITFVKSGKYTNAVINYFKPEGRQQIKTATVASFFKKNGKLYQLKKKEVTYDAAIE